MIVAYLINQYPQISHSFIRREIAGVESAGVAVHRFTVRRWPGQLVDPADQVEKERTRAILDAGPLALIGATVVTFLTRPLRFASTFFLAWKLARRSPRGLLRHAAYVAEACLLRRWLAAIKADHLHTHFGTNSTAVAMLCRTLGGPGYSFTVHGPEEFDAPRALALDEKICRAAFVVAISSFGRGQLFRWCDRSQWPKIKVVHCGVDEAFFADLQAGDAAVTEEPKLVCVGRLEEQKGQLLLLEAIARLAKRNIAVQLTLIGDGSLRKPIEDFIRDHHLENQVDLAGWVGGAGIRAQILASRALILPSFAEGLPVVLMEAMALGRPVVSTMIAGIPELVKDQTNGLLIAAGSVDDLVVVIEQILATSPQELREMGRAGQQRVRDRHDSRREAAKLAALLQEAVGSRMPG